MKYLLIIALLNTLVFGKIITIIDNGVKRKISIPTPTFQARALGDKKEKKELIIAFNKKINILEFAKKYNLELKRKIGKKYYIFKNTSSQKDIELMQTIMSQEKNLIKTIRPNWGFGFKAR